MRDRDLDLIAALVEGRLEDETEARALIASDPEFQAEYESQKLAYEALSNLGPAMLTEMERSALHRDVWTELRSQDVAAEKTRSPWYYRWAPVAAGMFVVVGLVAVINQSGGGGDAAMEAATATTAADSAEGGDSGGETSAPAPTDGVEPDITALLSQDFSRAMTAADVAYYEAEAEKVRTGDVDTYQFEDEEAEQSSRIETCLESAELTGFEVIGAGSPSAEDAEGGVAVPEDANPYVAAIPEDTALEDAPIAFVDLLTCELIYVDQ